MSFPISELKPNQRIEENTEILTQKSILSNKFQESTHKQKLMDPDQNETNKKVALLLFYFLFNFALS